ncbi:hypothetical protein MMC25_004696 [Agyrium rufum]|nr:hypothetical protein [Agyrium rufum]
MYESSIESIFKAVEEILLSSASLGPFSAIEAQKTLDCSGGIQIPFAQPIDVIPSQHQFTYEKPSRIELVGEFSRKMCLKSDEPLTAAIVATMPKVIFQEKDYLDYRYSNKRAFYLSCVASELQHRLGPSIEFQFTYEDDDTLKPVINLVQKVQKPDLTRILNTGHELWAKSRWQLMILLAADTDQFPIAKTMPWKRCLRISRGSKTELRSAGIATPGYNSSVRSDLVICIYERILRQTQSSVRDFLPACMLGKLWLRQRGFSNHHRSGGFGGFDFALLMSLLLRTEGPEQSSVLKTGYTALQLFMGTLKYIVKRDLLEHPYTIAGRHEELPVGTACGSPMLIDRIRGLNILCKMTPWSYEGLRYEAEATLQTLSRPTRDTFSSTFLTKLDVPELRADLLIWIPCAKHLTTTPGLSKSNVSDDLVEFALRIHQTVQQGLGKRANLINLKLPQSAPWHVHRRDIEDHKRGGIWLEILLNPEMATRTVDRGPSAEDTVSVKAFCAFWGEKAELRRYQDGSILESVVWPHSPDQDIATQIVHFLIRRHVSAETAENLFILPTNVRCHHVENVGSSARQSIPTEAYRKVLAALENQIRNLPGIPLQIRRIATCLPLFPSSPPSTATLLSPSGCSSHPVSMIIQFESSGRWPDLIPSIQRTKAAFLLKLASQKSGSGLGPTAQVGLENEDKYHENSPFIEVREQSGVVVQVRIQYEREAILLLGRVQDKSLSKVHRNSEAAALLSYKRIFEHAPRHSQIMESLASRYKMLLGCIEALQDWCSAQMLSTDILPLEIIQLFTAHVFISPTPFAQQPVSIRSGFLRTLAFIATWSWQINPLVINSDGAMDAAKLLQIQTTFEAWRNIDPAMDRVTIFVAYPGDESGIIWTDRRLGKVVVMRLQALARAAIKTIQIQAMSTDLSFLFRPDLAEYDFVLHLKPNATQGSPANSRPKTVFRNISLNSDAVSKGQMEMYTRSVHDFIQDVRNLYRDMLLCFYDESRLKTIGFVWSPETKIERPWRLGADISVAPQYARLEATSFVANRKSIMHEIVRLGGAFISRLELKP